jgi:uncharacterized protein YbaP (TraB family)
VRLALWTLVAVVACRHDAKAPPPAADPWAGSAAAKSDPWAVTPTVDPDAAPTLTQRHAIADKACPRVTWPYFFTVEKDGRTSYLLGTRHLGVPLAKMPGTVRDHIRDAKLAVFEVAPDDHYESKLPDMDLRAQVGEAVWSRYAKLVGRDVADRLRMSRPTAALLMMEAEFEDLSATLDKEIETEVADHHIPARGLEAARFQDDLLEKLMDVRAFRTAVEQTKDRAELQQDTVDDLGKYCAGDGLTAGMEDKERTKMRAAGYSDAELDAIDDELVYQRNAKWIPELDEIFKQDDVVVVVGAGHMIGPRGVPALLSARGYHVVRISR